LRSIALQYELVRRYRTAAG